MYGQTGGFGGITPILATDPLYGPSCFSPFGQHWTLTTRVNYAWRLVGYDQPWSVDENDANRAIAIIDSGIAPLHPEFFGDTIIPSKIHSESRSFFEGGDSLDLFCDCRESSYEPLSNVEDTAWQFGVSHGTILAGLAAAYGDNGVGVAGNCWDCSLLILRVLAIQTSTYDPEECAAALEGCWYSEQTIADAINFAAGWIPGLDPDYPNSWGPVRARVITTALTTPSIYDDVCDDGNLIAKAVDNAFNRGCVIIAITGNQRPSGNSPPCWDTSIPGGPNCTEEGGWMPTGYPGLITHGLSLNPKTITVGGACRTGAAWHCTSKVNPPMGDLGICGPGLYPNPAPDGTAPVISVVAPIEEMVTVTASDEDLGCGVGYRYLDEYDSGTSWAAPQVAGVAALMLKTDPTLTPTQVKFILEVTATDIDLPGYDRRTGHGLLNAQAAIEYVKKQEFPADWDGDGLVAPIDAVLYAVDLAAGNAMTDLNLDATQTADDMTIFLESYTGN